uniref:Uncharacterized protein n=1 Tax=Rhizophora mucronata TaxID=61149 RepID=A0A2P2PUP2_RHIMU
MTGKCKKNNKARISPSFHASWLQRRVRNAEDMMLNHFPFLSPL